MFLVTIENDAEAGRFPEVAANFFASESWSISARYFVAAMGQLHPEPKSVVGRVSFECSPNQLGQVLAQQNGFRWGSNLSVGGIQVRETDVPEALQLNPFVSLDGKRLEALVRFAWAASRDLDELGLFVSPGNDDLVEKLFRLLKA